jgi:hypothetical protein
MQIYEETLMRTGPVSSVLQGCVAAAQTDADRFHGAAPVRPWRPALHRATRLWLLGALVLGAGVAGAVVVQRLGEPLRSAPVAFAASPPAPIDAPRYVPPAPAESPWGRTAAVPARTTMRLDHGELTVDVTGMSRLQAVRQLAALTGSELVEQPGALDRAHSVTMAWRGRDIAAAWRSLLADEVSHAVHCAAMHCRVWVLGAVPREADAARAATARAPQAEVPALEQVAPSVPMVDEPMRPDPPGLFPSD